MIERLLPAGPDHRARLRVSSRDDGDFRVDGDPAALAGRRQAFSAGEWTWLRQVHGASVVRVDRPGAGAGAEADASVTTTPGAVLAVQTADCAPVVLVSDGVIAAIHAGWRGVVAGVIPAAVRAVRDHTEQPIAAVLGPVIRAHAYEFGEGELSQVASVAGRDVRTLTTDGRPALDMAAAVVSVLVGCGVHEIEDLGFDTADDRWFSHRVRGDSGRQVTTVVLESVA